MTILVADDEKEIADLVELYLKNEGYDIRKFHDGLAAWQDIQENPPDLAILDVMMPGMDGYQVARQVRTKRFGTPILMLTAKSDILDRVEGLNAGADYYLTKPFDTRELLACINALLRRQGEQVDTLCYGNTTLDLAAGTLSSGKERVRLSAREFDVMRLLMQTQDRNIPKEVLLARVWGYDSNAVENHVEVYVGFLRKKLRSIGSNLRIAAVRQLGYHLEVEGE